MMIYRRYLAREVAGAIVLVLVAFLALFGFFDMINEVKSVGRGSYQLYHAAAFVLMRMPGRIDAGGGAYRNAIRPVHLGPPFRAYCLTCFRDVDEKLVVQPDDGCSGFWRGDICDR